MDSHILLIDCSDEEGLIHKITGVIYKNNLNIISNREFVQTEDNYFFMRTEFSGVADKEKITKELYSVLPKGVNIRLTKKTKKNIVVLATKEHHCLAELLIQNYFNVLNANILSVISNHESLEELTSKFNIPYHHISHKDKTREKHESEVLYAINDYKPEYIVLAKYMRILSPEFISNFSNKIINIHHSFLPAFIGASPYKQAYKRGVKIIGATAHFANNNLDEGPILAQSVIHVDHTKSAEDMSLAGKDIERTVLMTALKLVFEDRIFVSGNKTIIFD